MFCLGFLEVKSKPIPMIYYSLNFPPILFFKICSDFMKIDLKTDSDTFHNYYFMNVHLPSTEKCLSNNVYNVRNLHLLVHFATVSTLKI